MAQTNPPFMSGVPELLILRLLIQQQMYGYELVRAIRSSTGDAMNIDNLQIRLADTPGDWSG